MTPQFSPTSERVIRFLDGLSALGAAPLNPELMVLKSSGRLRSFIDPLTGETKSFPANDRVPLMSSAELAATIAALQQYYIALEGQGPPRLRPFPLYSNNALFTGSYSFTLGCCLRAEAVSMSDLGDEQTENEEPSFGEGGWPILAFFCKGGIPQCEPHELCSLIFQSFSRWRVSKFDPHPLRTAQRVGHPPSPS
jgi:hypothetical protein